MIKTIHQHRSGRQKSINISCSCDRAIGSKILLYFFWLILSDTIGDWLNFSGLAAPWAHNIHTTTLTTRQYRLVWHVWSELSYFVAHFAVWEGAKLSRICLRLNYFRKYGSNWACHVLTTPRGIIETHWKRQGSVVSKFVGLLSRNGTS